MTMLLPRLACVTSVACLFLVGCMSAPPPEEGPGDEDLFGVGKADGTPDVDAIRNLELGTFSANEVLLAAENSEAIRDYFRDDPDGKTELLHHLMNRVDGDELEVHALFAGFGWEGGLLIAGGSGRNVDLKFITPQGSVATQRFKLRAERFGPQLGLEYGLVLGVLVNATPDLTLNDIDQTLLGGASVDGALSAWPLSGGAAFYPGGRFDLVLVSIGVGWDYSLALNQVRFELCEECPPTLDALAE